MSAQKGAIPLPLIIGVLAIAAVAFFFFSKSTPAPAPTSDKPQAAKEESQAALDYQDVLNLGGTCFTKPFEDQTDYLESQKEASPDIVRVTDKNQYDAQRISMGAKDDQLVVQFDFKEDPPIDEHHVFRFWIYRDVGNPRDEDRTEIQWIPADKKWAGSYVSAERVQKNFDPKTQVSGKSVRFNIPKELLAKDGKVEKINFTVLVVDKTEKTTYADRIWASEGGPSSKFTCL